MIESYSRNSKTFKQVVESEFKSVEESARTLVEQQRKMDKNVNQYQLEKDNIPSDDTISKLANSRDSLIAQQFEIETEIEK